jgi:hypothetical protein
VVAPAEALPFPDASFDAVTCVTAIHHADAPRAIAEMRRVSRGPIAITVLKRSPQAGAIVTEILRQLRPVSIVEEEKDLICIHDPRPGRDKDRPAFAGRDDADRSRDARNP